MAEKIVIKPQAGKQESFLSSSADVVLYGGAAGGGKTFGLLLEALRHVKNGKFGAVIFRRTYRQVMNEGGLWDEAANLYPYAGGAESKSEMKYTFPSGARVSFAHLQHEKDLSNYQGAQIALIGFDELTHFTERMFFYLLSRNRSISGIKPYVRCTSNPDADSFVAKFIDWWWDDETGYPIPERAGVVRYFVRISDVTHWADTTEELERDFGDEVKPKSFTFIPANLYDNQILMQKDPGYLANLKAQGEVDEERLLHGNWKIRPEAGKVFNRSWFKFVDVLPEAGMDLRFWDFAATEMELKDKANKDPDYTASVKMRFWNGNIYITDMTVDRIAAGEIDQKMEELAKLDKAEAKSRFIPYALRWEQEPAGAGKRETWRMTTKFQGYDAAGIPPQGDKVTRAKPLAAQARVGNVYLLKGHWNDEFLTNLHHFPDFGHDDIVDASSGAYSEIIQMAGDTALAEALA